MHPEQPVPEHPQQPEHAEPPKELCCPLSLDLFADPVVLVESGETYERAHILRWLQGLADGAAPLTDPCTRQVLRSPAVASNQFVRRQVREWCERHGRSPPSAPAASPPPAPHPVAAMQRSNETVLRAAVGGLGRSIPQWVGMLGSDDYQARCRAADAVGALAHDAATCASIAGAGAIPALVRLLGSSEGMAVSWYAARALRNLANGDVAYCASIAAAGAISPLVRLLARDGEYDACAINALCILAEASADNCRSICAAGAIPHLVRLLSSEDREVLGWAVETVGILAQASVAHRDGIVGAGAIPPLVRLLDDEDAEVQDLAAAALGHLQPDRVA